MSLKVKFCWKALKVALMTFNNTNNHLILLKSSHAFTRRFLVSNQIRHSSDFSFVNYSINSISFNYDRYLQVLSSCQIFQSSIKSFFPIHLKLLTKNNSEFSLTFNFKIFPLARSVSTQNNIRIMLPYLILIKKSLVDDINLNQYRSLESGFD